MSAGTPIEEGDGAGEAPLSVWHYPKVVGRPFALTLTIGASSEVAQEYATLSLADAKPGADHRFAELLGVAWAERAVVHDVFTLPEGLLGLSSHTHA
ncbi:MAG: hypothetical protein AAF211_20930, partial [Myxococcota bacterium]